MKRAAVHAAGMAILCLGCGWAATPQTPEVINGKVENRALAGYLAQELERLASGSASPLWVAYTVPAVSGQNSVCQSDENGVTRTRDGVVRLEGAQTLVVLYRFENHALDRVRISSLDCQFDAGGVAFVYLTGVPEAQSVGYLAELAHRWAQAGRRPHFDSLITAIALHRDSSADTALKGMLAESEPELLREKALFWLAQARGRTGFEAVRKQLESDPSDRVREKAAFALTVSQDKDAIPALIQAAKKDRSPHVRGQALFWLAKRGGSGQAEVILQSIQQDTDAHVRRQGVFALQQIPGGEGIPLLIQIARTSTDQAVRKQAVFWLGQSHDPRAVAFFEETLRP